MKNIIILWQCNCNLGLIFEINNQLELLKPSSEIELNSLPLNLSIFPGLKPP